MDQAGLDEILTPRSDLLDEEAVGDGDFVCGSGPFREYRRQVTIQTLPDGLFDVTEITDFKLAVPVWGLLFALPIRSVVRRRRHGRGGKPPWWAPPARLDHRAATVLSL